MNKENAYKLFHKTNGIYITTPFGYRNNPFTGVREFHEGVDYGTNKEKIPVYPIVDGKVLRCGVDITKAKYVYVYFKELNMVGLYYHLDRINVKNNEVVNTNTILGYTGMTGKATGIHLHFDLFPYADYKLPIMKRNNVDYNSYKFTNPSPTPSPSLEIKLGDSVIVNGIGYATSFGAGLRTRRYNDKAMKVIHIIKGRKYGYALNQYNKGEVGNFKDITAWFKKEDLKLIK